MFISYYLYMYCLFGLVRMGVTVRIDVRLHLSNNGIFQRRIYNHLVFTIGVMLFISVRDIKVF